MAVVKVSDPANWRWDTDGRIGLIPEMDDDVM